MTNRLQSYYSVLFFACIIVVQAKIVYLNGTEVTEDSLKEVNVTTRQPTQKWFSVFNPKNISNHSGEKTKTDLHTLNRKNDVEEQEVSTIETVEEENDQYANGTLSTRDTTLLSSIRGIWSDLSPLITILSTILGLFIIFVIVQSPLSPLPVPPLPYPPIGPFPPTNLYPFGVPPVRKHYGVKYVGPPTQGGYRIPRNLQTSNETEIMEKMIEKVIDSIIPNELEDFFTSKTHTWAKQLAHGIKSFFINLSTGIGNKGSELLEEITISSKGEL